MELIDREKLKASIRSMVELPNEVRAKVIGAINRAKAVDIVHCKDCQHYDNSEGICWCHLNSRFYPGGVDWHSFPEDGFCYYGERKVEDGKVD